MVDQTISYNDKSATQRGLGKEVHNSQRLLFIQKELQLNTNFHYIEVAATSENYKITLCISKTIVKEKIVLHTGLQPIKTKNPKKNLKKGKDKKKECERERKGKGKGEGKGEGRGERERKEEKKRKKRRER